MVPLAAVEAAVAVLLAARAAIAVIHRPVTTHRPPRHRDITAARRLADLVEARR